MGQCQIADPAASRKLVFWIQPHDRPAPTLNSLGRCVKVIDPFRRVAPKGGATIKIGHHAEASCRAATRSAPRRRSWGFRPRARTRGGCKAPARGG